jgi:hypothetical protein
MLIAVPTLGMILYPLNSSHADNAAGGRAGPAHTGILSAWEAVFQTQTQPATEWWLVAQPDHAALAGDLAARISSPDFPSLDVDVLLAITLHDEGWAQFDGGEIPRLNGKGQPKSFLETAVPEFLRAWRDSIERAEQVAPIGGILVSEHFSRLANGYLQSDKSSPEDRQVFRDFLQTEAERQKQLSRKQSRSSEEINLLVDLLQFCDLVSLYLCCGSQASIEFPQTFNGKTIRLLREGESCRTDPPLFGAGASLAVRARRWPSPGVSRATSIPFLLT